MSLKKIFLFYICILLLCSCADYRANEVNKKNNKKYYTSNGFALVYDTNLYEQKIVNKKINNEDIKVMHNILKVNTLVKIINPNNSKFVETKIHKKANFPKIFNVVISKKTALILELDINNPYVEIIEIKKNKTFIAKESVIFDEEKNVVQKAPVDEIVMDNLINEIDNLANKKKKNKVKKEKKFTLVIGDFYYEDSAINLKNELLKENKIHNISIKKINNKKYRLLTGPFKNFNALKTTYISLNNLGFENLEIYRD